MPKSARLKHAKSLAKKYPPSEPCTCEMCLHYCNHRPGWWTVKEAAHALDVGCSPHMMPQISSANGMLVPGAICWRDGTNP